jgi:predicted enzyme related to lactoylglutathione lyase
MDYVSTGVITNDIKRLVAFYEKITQLKANWLNELFAEVETPHGALAIGAVETRKLFGAESIQPASSQSATIEFRVDDVGQPLAAVPRPGRQSGQLLHAGEPGSEEEVWRLAGALFRD